MLETKHLYSSVGLDLKKVYLTNRTRYRNRFFSVWLMRPFHTVRRRSRRLPAGGVADRRPFDAAAARQGQRRRRPQRRPGRRIERPARLVRTQMEAVGSVFVVSSLFFLSHDSSIVSQPRSRCSSNDRSNYRRFRCTIVLGQNELADPRVTSPPPVGSCQMATVRNDGTVLEQGELSERTGAGQDAVLGVLLRTARGGGRAGAAARRRAAAGARLRPRAAQRRRRAAQRQPAAHRTRRRHGLERRLHVRRQQTGSSAVKSHIDDCAVVGYLNLKRKEI